MRGCLISLGEFFFFLSLFFLTLLSSPFSSYYESKTNEDISMISYPNYKFIFPIKALGMYAKRFGDEAIF